MQDKDRNLSRSRGGGFTAAPRPQRDTCPGDSVPVISPNLRSDKSESRKPLQPRQHPAALQHGASNRGERGQSQPCQHGHHSAALQPESLHLGNKTPETRFFFTQPQENRTKSCILAPYAASRQPLAPDQVLLRLLPKTDPPEQFLECNLPRPETEVL